MERKIKGKRVALFFVFAISSIALPTVGAYLGIYLFGIPKGVVEDFIGDNLVVVLASLLAYYLAIIPVWSYLATWASKIEPKEGVAPISKDELITKLLALNDPELPWTIRRGEKEDLIAEWKIVDAKWIDIFAANKINIIHKLRIDLGQGVAHVQDVERKVSYRVGADGRPTATLRWSGHRGIDFYQYDWSAAYGVIYKDGKLKIDFAYKYKFNLQEMKNPIIEAVTENGWAWKGALSISPFWRIIFGG